MQAPSMRRRAALAATALLGAVLLASLAPSAVPPARATTPREALATAGRLPAGTAVATAIVPGTVNRSSLRMTATYAVTARLGLAARSLRGSVAITTRNDSGAGVDRLRL